LIIDSVGLLDYGAYKVRVSNDYGWIDSDTVALRKIDLTGWGANGLNQISMPEAATNLVSVACGLTHMVGLKSDGRVIAWGDNSYNKTVVPVTATSVVAIAASDSHSLALRSDGTMISWGAINNVPAALSNVVAIASGPLQDAALLADGSVHVWGNNLAAQRAEGWTNVMAIAAGGLHLLGLKRDGTVIGMGNNSAGQITVPATATHVVAIAASLSGSLALRVDGTVVSWGRLMPTGSFQVTVNGTGSSTTTAPCNPDPELQPANATNVVAIAMGRNHALVLRRDGTLVTWGDNSGGQTTLPPGLTQIRGVAAGGFFSSIITGSPAPQFGFIPSENTFGFHEVGILAIAASGRYPMACQWYLNGAAIVYATNIFMALSDITGADAGVYGIVLSNLYGTASNSITVNVTNSNPRIAQQPQGGLYLAGDAVELTVRVMGSELPQYQWQLNGTNIKNGGPISGATGPVLRISPAAPGHSGNYRAQIIADASLVSSNATVTVLDDNPLRVALDASELTWTTGGDAPWGWENTTSMDGVDAAVCGTLIANQSSWIETTVSGPVNVSFAYRVSSDSFWGGHLQFIVDGAVVTDWMGEIGWTNQLQLLPLGNHILRWRYYWDRSFTGGLNMAWLDQVQISPYNPIPVQIVTQPSSVTNRPGATVQFSVVATGNPVPAYQWKFNGNSLEGATNATLKMTSVTMEQIGVYSVIVSNEANHVESANAWLALTNGGPAFVKQPASVKLAFTQDLMLTAQTSGSEPMSYQWFLNGEPLSGATAATLLVTNLHIQNYGVYELLAANSLGVVMSQAALVDWSPVAAFGANAAPVARIDRLGDVSDVHCNVAYGTLLVRTDGSIMAIPISAPTVNTVPQLQNVASLSGDYLGLGIMRKDGTVALQNSRFIVPQFLVANAVAVDASDVYGIMAVLDDGSLLAWYWDGTPTMLPAGLNHIVSVAVGATRVLALRDDGVVLTFIANNQVVIAEGLTNIVAITTSKTSDRYIALREDGTIIYSPGDVSGGGSSDATSRCGLCCQDLGPYGRNSEGWER